MNIENIRKFIKEKAVEFGARIDIEFNKSYVERNNTGREALNDNGAYFGFIHPDEETSSDDYKNYLLKFGTISFGNTELTGLNVEKYANVVDVTAKEIELNESFPKDCIVLEKIGVENLLILINSKGEVLEWKNNKCKKIYNSLEDYLKSKI